MSVPEPAPAPLEPDLGPWSEPWSRLRELDRLLQGAGLPTGPDRWQNAQDLLASLAAGHRLPADPQRVRALLAPLFCRSPDEQRRFAQVFDQWLGQAGAPTADAAPTPVRRAAKPRKPPPQTRLRPILLGLGVLVMALAFGLYRWLQPVAEPPGPGQTPPTIQPIDPAPIKGSSDGYLKLPLEPIRPRTPPESLGPGPDARRWLAVGDWLLPALPGLALLAWVAWRALRRRDVLRYRKGDADSPLRHLTLAGEDDELFTDPALRSALRRLHTPVRVPTTRLDERATVERTARRQGLFAPVYRDLPRVPDLVVLVDFQHRADHLAGLAETLVLRLREAGIEVHRYPFQRHPARVLGPRGQGIGLAELAARHAGARLLIVGDPAAFVDPWRGSAADWTQVLALWPRRALLATRAVPDPWRAALEGAGLALAPFGEAGLIRLAGHLTQAPATAGGLPESTLPGALGTSAAAFDPAPDVSDRRALLADLDAWLGPHGGLLLAAAAVYPEVHPGLTRLLDQALFPADPAATRAQRLLRLARLPWLRAGHLPDWLRLALSDRTGRAEARRIGAIYRELLARASVDGDEALRLPVAVSGSPRSWLARLRTAWRERGWRLGRWVHDLAALAGPDAPLQDRNFLDAVLRPRLLDFLLPRRLARRLPRRPGGFSGFLAATALALLLGLGLHLAWRGGDGFGQPGLRAVAAQAAQAAEALSRRGVRVEIIHTPGTAGLAAGLAGVLTQGGFPAPGLVELSAPAADAPGPDQPAAAVRRVNTVQIGAAATVAPGAFAAARLQYLAWGDPSVIADRLTDPPPGADAALADTPPAGNLIRVWLTTTGHGAVFADPLARPLTDAERARFQNPKGLDLPEPTLPRPKVFRDRLKNGTDGPAMVARPGGTFQMGSPEDEPERADDEGPRHEVRVQPVAIGQTEVSFADYDRFAEATGRKKPNDQGWGRGDRPVINVSWNDATTYAAWLAEQTGQPYRLPTEAEWEYAARAGTDTPFWTGKCVNTDQANYDGKYDDYNDCGAKTGVYREKTVPVGSLPANPWGLHEVAGNVWEWTCSIYAAPYDGQEQKCESNNDVKSDVRRVVRGGGWNFFPGRLRSAYRNWNTADEAGSFLGLRLARTL
ncbi:SUMF1/EgtB/PvdO family nonheme iron enzyme [uncultured Thiodictyon sp.]|uniref:SUMF1/EgtB/PvdO family nonheme iron enzyme n=1 Tax=uncultured Thiodictyon sp. TaxID=1846217 RepID=UPI0025F22B15|nr:SUMF1/EgtB/PvdO family nonheme iron enzyme [uncultured Thiodictyon sp.]